MAENLWKKILLNREKLNKKLNRTVNIGVAALDFFQEHHDYSISNPLIIEEKLFDEIKRRVLVDDLTGLYNYRYFKNRIKEEISKSRRYNAVFSIIMLDIDDFKHYNDTFGHIEGNKVLKKIADLLQKALRSADVVIRFGGEEFLIILPQINKKAAIIVGDKIRKKLSKLKLKKAITISGGVATYLTDTKNDENDLIYLADMALYRAKYEGKNRICNFPLERRIYTRIPYTNDINISIKIISPNAITKKTNIKDISIGGLAIFTEKKFNQGDIIKGKITKEGKTLKFISKVAWCSLIENTTHEIGLEFIEVSNAQLKAFLNKIS